MIRSRVPLHCLEQQPCRPFFCSRILSDAACYVGSVHRLTSTEDKAYFKEMLFDLLKVFKFSTFFLHSYTWDWMPSTKFQLLFCTPPLCRPGLKFVMSLRSGL